MVISMPDCVIACFSPAGIDTGTMRRQPQVHTPLASSYSKRGSFQIKFLCIIDRNFCRVPIYELTCYRKFLSNFRSPAFRFSGKNRSRVKSTDRELIDLWIGLPPLFPLCRTRSWAINSSCPEAGAFVLFALFVSASIDRVLEYVLVHFKP